ncbi:hypothetical protein F751_6940 [Auxenochlorella protothecoides]|uniref:Uncharacterized protein n=1 Tax=Auxenochlorella protothecoides TaxID=3075 RepID=A0A087SR19_AUXPR|nr:hypothetical protein F751_6940 [Auxenochlorella protothecoides]KFM28173.1 hypothetical protein F751_6940 [Auxenochlorella protothecoides]
MPNPLLAHDASPALRLSMQMRARHPVPFLPRPSACVGKRVHVQKENGPGGGGAVLVQDVSNSAAPRHGYRPREALLPGPQRLPRLLALLHLLGRGAGHPHRHLALLAVLLLLAQHLLALGLEHLARAGRVGGGERALRCVTTGQTDESMLQAKQPQGATHPRTQGLTPFFAFQAACDSRFCSKKEAFSAFILIFSSQLVDSLGLRSVPARSPACFQLRPDTCRPRLVECLVIWRSL